MFKKIWRYIKKPFKAIHFAGLVVASIIILFIISVKHPEALEESVEEF